MRDLCATTWIKGSCVAFFCLTLIGKVWCELDPLLLLGLSDVLGWANLVFRGLRALLHLKNRLVASGTVVLLLVRALVVTLLTLMFCHLNVASGTLHCHRVEGTRSEPRVRILLVFHILERKRVRHAVEVPGFAYGERGLTFFIAVIVACRQPWLFSLIRLGLSY